jgi:serine/threonine protein kinase
MDERAARRPNLELVKSGEARTTSGLMPVQGGDGITTGTLLDDRYLVGRIVGAGAVGIVFEAKNVELDEKVAIKCLRPEMLADKGMVGRFAREAKAAAALKSEYVASVFDVGTTPDGVPYIVMEYLDGKDLGTAVAETGPVSPRTAVEYALQVCEALAVAHAKGIVHRDIKPENLLLTERAGGMRIVKVLDFGISKTALTGSIFKNELPVVKTVNLMGTPLYMSPEQVRVSDSVDVRSDIWSLGMVIYEILTGETAFNGQSITEVCAAILEATPKSIDSLRTDLPPGLVDVIAKCLEKDVTRRYQNVAELALALMPFGPKRTRLNVERAVAVLQAAGQVDPSVSVNSTRPPPADSRLPETPIPPAPSVPRISIPNSAASLPVASSVYPEKKRGVGVIIAVIALLVGVGGAATVWMNRKPPPSPVTTEPTATALVTATAEAPKPAPVPSPVVAPSVSAPAVAAPPTTPAPTVPAKPAWATAPRVHAPPPTPKAAASTVKPKATSEEPDLGY